MDIYSLVCVQARHFSLHNKKIFINVQWCVTMIVIILRPSDGWELLQSIPSGARWPRTRRIHTVLENVCTFNHLQHRHLSFWSKHSQAVQLHLKKKVYTIIDWISWQESAWRYTTAQSRTSNQSIHSWPCGKKLGSFKCSKTYIYSN